MTTTTQIIPLNKLVPWSGNVRKTNSAADIEELAASIASHGLLNPLLIRKDQRGKFAVIAGQRRLLALQSLAARDRLDADAAIECRIADDNLSPVELSLAENVVRAAMHPADEFEAFRDLVQAGANASAVALRFGVSEHRVEQRLRLGSLSPIILSAYRQGDLGLEEAMAFTLSSDHQAQDRVFADLPPWQCKPSSIRRALTHGEIPASDPRVQLIGLEAYAQAGGPVRRDLFDDENAGYLQDSALLDSLCMVRLGEAAEAIRAEGWSWVECVLDLDWNTLSGFSRVHPEHEPLTAQLEAERSSLQSQLDAFDDCEDDDVDHQRDDLEQRIQAIDASSARWTAESLAVGGAIVTVSRSGELDVRRGLVRPSDAKAAKKARRPESADTDSRVTRLPSTLVAELSAQKTAALAATLMKQPDVALAVTVHALALDVFYDGLGDSCARLKLSQPSIESALFDAEKCKAYKALDAEQSRWRKRLPKDTAELFVWCLEQERSVLLDLLAVVAAHSVDLIVTNGQSDAPQQAHCDAISNALSFDLASWYRPSAEGYFAKLPRAAIIAAIEEASGKPVAPAWQKLKRDELAKKAAKSVSATRWLPAYLRATDKSAS